MEKNVGGDCVCPMAREKAQVIEAKSLIIYIQIMKSCD